MNKNSTLNPCRLCNKQDKLISAHILPKQFFVDIKDKDNQDILISSSKGRGGITKNGITDNTILCQSCDNRLGIYDNEAIHFFRLDFSKYKRELKEDDKAAHYYEIPQSDVNMKKLLLFFVSFLWRASISNQPFFCHRLFR